MDLRSLGLHGRKGILANLRSNRNQGLYLVVVERPPDLDALEVSHVHLGK